jgi:hypothetical protein
VARALQRRAPGCHLHPFGPARSYNAPTFPLLRPQRERNINYEGFLYILRPPVCFVRNHRRRLIAVAVFDSTENVPENSSSLAFTHIGRRGLDWVYRRHAEFRGFMVLDDVCSCDRRGLHGRRSLQVGVIPLASLFAASASLCFPNRKNTFSKWGNAHGGRDALRRLQTRSKLRD